MVFIVENNGKIKQMQKTSYWLMKSEPNVWSINQQKIAGNNETLWEGVRNYQSAKNIKKKPSQ